MSSRVAMRRWQLALRLTVAALVWSLGLILAALLVPAYGTNSSGTDGLTLTSSTLVQAHGAGALAAVVLPAIASLVVLGAILHHRRDGATWSARVAWTAIGVVIAESLLGILSVGAFMLPAAVLLTLSMRLLPARRPAPAGLAADS
jgi:hypothetical protein